MRITLHKVGIALTAVAVMTATGTAQSTATATKPNAVLWVDPVDLPNRDLRAGLRLHNAAPTPPFTFLKEETAGTQPKFKVRDSAGVEWTVKLGPEAQSETAATRLVWAAGYFADENYFVPEATIRHLPALARGAADLVRDCGVVFVARFVAARDESTSIGKFALEVTSYVGSHDLIART